MSTIEELRRRVESAERRFGLIDEQERRYSERLIDLMNALEAAQGEQQAAAATHRARLAELERENGELRGMLHALLLGVEAGSRDMLAATLRDLDGRLSGLLGATPVAHETAEAPAEVAVTDAVADEALVETIGEEPWTEDGLLEDAFAVAVETVAMDAAEQDAVTAAEQAVAELIGGDATLDLPAADAVVLDGGEGPESTALVDGGEGPGATSPVAEMIGRLEEETQFFPEPEAADEAPAAASKPARKQA